MVLLLFDGNNLVMRARHAIGRGVREPDADEIVDSVMATVRNMLRAHAGPHLRATVVFDGKGATAIKRDIYPGYKAKRDKERPPSIEQAIETLRLQRHSFGNLRFDGREADDVIASASRQATDGGGEVLIVTSDYDILQCVGDGCDVLLMGAKRGEQRRINTAAFDALWGFLPPLMADYKALAGDTSDGLPGVRGIGPTAAKYLVGMIGTVEEIYRTLYDRAMEARIRKCLEAGRDDAVLMKSLTRLDFALPEVAGFR